MNLRFALILFYCLFLDLKPQCQVIDLEQDGNTFIIPCNINGLPLKFILDTGADEVAISLTEAAFMLKHGYLLEDDFIGSQQFQIASGELIEGTTVNIRELTIGEITIHNVQASIVHSSNAPLLLGQSVLNQFGRITIDFEKRQLIIGSYGVEDSQKIVRNELAETALMHGDDSLFDGNYEGALECFSRAIRLDKNNIIAYIKKGDTYFEMNNLHMSILYYSKANEIDSLNVEAIHKRGFTYRVDGNNELALVDLTKAINIDSTNYPSHYQRGLVYMNLANFSEAIKDFSFYINHFPKSKVDIDIDFYEKRLITPALGIAYSRRGIAKYELKDFQGAIDDLNEGLKYFPDDPELYYYKALSYGQQSNLAGYNQNLMKALELDDENPKYWMAQAKGCLAFALPDCAIESCTKVIELEPDNSLAYWLRGRVYYQRGELAKACLDYKKAKELGEDEMDKYIKEACQ